MFAGMIVEIHNLTKRYGATVVLESVDLRIGPAEKIGLVGANGAGKTTFARIAAGLDDAYDGSCRRAPGTVAAYVPQHLQADSSTTCLEYLTSDIRPLKSRLEAAESELAQLDQDDPDAVDAALRAYQRVRDAYDAAGGDAAYGSALAALDAVGLPGRGDSPLGELSGGERNVLTLAGALARRPDLLVLDEPGNHLDFDGLDWLERFIGAYQGAVLIVSHNRYLLDRTTTATIEIEQRRVRRYEGNYSAYRIAKLRDVTARQADHAADARKLARLEALVARFAQIAQTHADPAWGRRLRARRTQLGKAREAAVEKPELSDASISVAFVSEPSQADIAVELVDYRKSYGTNVLFDDTSALIKCGERVAIVGPNGSGKTSLLRDIVEHGSWDHPHLRVGPSMRIGYCAQHQEIFRGSASILDEMIRFGVRTPTDAIKLLGRYLFTYADLSREVGSLSGGELNRLQFAVCETSGANLLVLDEPTNHMDIASREAIEDALDSFTGTIILVSHDRYLIDAVAGRVLEIADRSLVSWDGSYTAYRAARRGEARLHTRRRERASGAGSRAKPAQHPGTHAAELERRITRLEEQKLSLEREITAAFHRGDHVGGRRLTNELERTARELGRCWENWMEMGEHETTNR